jgi:hypothetical protein
MKTYILLIASICIAVSIYVLFEGSRVQEFYTNQSIPKIVHYVYLYGEQPAEFNLVYAMSILSAVAVIHPTHIYFWCESEPHGPWWDLVKRHVDIQRVTAPTHIGAKPLKKGAHKADIVRMQKLMEHGGIYMDLDTITVRPIDDMLQNDMVMGKECDYGLCNAIMMANKDSNFLHKWWSAYESVFEPDGWSEASVVYPRTLSKSEPSISIYSEDTFFKPSHNEIEKIFVDFTQEIPPNLRILHFWESHSRKYFTFQSIEDMKNSTSLYGAIVRHLFQTTNLSSLVPSTPTKA